MKMFLKVNHKKSFFKAENNISWITYKKSAFTLAEVLITIGIIGVVAALTIPNLISAYNNHITETRLKKFYSTFNQAIQRSVADNGDYMNWDYCFNGTYDDSTGETPEDYSETLNSKFKKYLAPYMNIIEEKDVRWTNFASKGVNMHLYYFEDGSAFGYSLIQNRDIYYFPKNAEKCLAKSSYETGICVFSFEFVPDSTLSSREDWKYIYGKGLEPYKYAWDGTVQSLYSGKTYSCKNHYQHRYCAALIQYYGWKIPKDFPVKIKY